jgi:S-DNA-T family DNA segregation ATPase FtsK/SpoIIIE
MTEQQHVNGQTHQRIRTSGLDDRPPVEDLDVPAWLHDTSPAPGYTDLAEHLEAQENDQAQQQDAVPAETVANSNGSTEPAEDTAEPRRPFHRVRAVAGHRVTRGAARQAVYVGAGAVLTRRHLRDERTTARHHRFMRAAEDIGDHATALEWEQRASQHRAARHARRMALLHAAPHVVKNTAYVVAGTAGGLVLLGVCLAVANKDPHQVTGPIMFAVDAIRFLVTLASVAFAPAVALAILAGLLTLWHKGRKGAVLPTWLLTTAEADRDLVIDENTIALALDALRIPQITAYRKKGLPFQFLTPARKDGRGTHAVLRLPLGLPAEEISEKRRKQLAAGLYRSVKEVWPTTGNEAGILDLWVADKGALEEGAGLYPLLDEGLVDFFKGVPIGKTLRGDPVLAPLVGTNTICGGMPGQGKSSSARAIVAGASLDPTCEIRVWIPDSNFDFEAMRPRCSRYVMGAEKTKIEQIRDDLVELHAELQRRGDLLIKHEEPQVTRKLASAGIGLHPMVCLLEEAHVAINDKEFGEEISGLLVEIVKLCRKRGVHMIVSTQAPTKDSIPRDVTRNCTNGIAFAVSDHVANDALLGQGAYRAGNRATELLAGVDIGTAMVKGITEARAEIVQFYFLSVSKGNDQVTPLVKRSLAEIERLGKPLPGPNARPVVVKRDLLADVAKVLERDREPVKIADIPRRLRELAPTWRPYAELNGTALRERLEDQYGIKVPTTGNKFPVDPSVIREALARRSDGSE